MKKFWLTVIAISFSIAIVFASIGIINYVGSENKTQTESIQGSVSAEIYEVQEEMSSLYLLKSDYETERTEIECEIEEKLANLEESDETTASEIAALNNRLVAVEEEIERIQRLIDSLQVTLDNLLAKLNTISMLPSTNKISDIFPGTEIGEYTYIAPANGYFQVTCFMTNGGSVYLKTDSFNFYLRGSLTADVGSCLIPCRAGDVINIEIADKALRSKSYSVFVYSEVVA